MYWFWFTAINSEKKEVRATLPADNQNKAENELIALGYEHIVFIDCYPFRDYSNTSCA